MDKRHLVGALAAVTLLACSNGSKKSGEFTLDGNAVRLPMVRMQQTLPERVLTMHVTGKDVAYVGAAFPSGRPGWLFVDVVPTGPDTAAVTVSLTTNELAPGEYSATFQVGTADAGGAVLATKDVRVTVGVVALDAAPAEIVLGGADGLTPGAQNLTFALHTGTTSKYGYTATLLPAGQDWLEASATTGTVGDLGTAVTLDAAAGVAPGTYHGEIELAVTYEDLQVVRRVPVTLNVEEHRLVVGEGGVGFTASPGRSVVERDVGVFSSLGRSVIWAASADQGWLTVTPSGVTGEPLHLSADPAGLAADTTHFAEVTVSSAEASVENTQKIRVGLTVRSAAAQDVSVTAAADWVAASPVEPIAFTAAGGTDVTVYDVDTGTVLRTLTGVATKADGIAVSPDGRHLYVYDGTSRKTSKRDAVTGELVRDFPPPTSMSVAAYGGMLAFRPGGHEVIVTPFGDVFDADTGAALGNPQDRRLGASYTLSATADGLHVAGSSGFAEVKYTALGSTHVRIVSGGVGTYAPMTQQGCITADRKTYYRAAAECGANGYGYAFCGWNVATREPIAPLPGKAYPAAIACPWNGLVIAGTDSFYDAQDLYFYDQSAALLGNGNSSKRTTNRSLVADGLAVSADGVRLVSLSRASPGYDPSDEIRFQTLPTP